jgi:hypothetical protein
MPKVMGAVAPPGSLALAVPVILVTVASVVWAKAETAKPTKAVKRRMSLRVFMAIRSVRVPG